ncbi:MAG TPA: tRNA (adenosine(37)-N6)-threonylcarbamoyltransferase complex transferase subunit TsaD [Candidatus Paceibacterota bacterium]|nr:tRNA (adenosine(37)-N6)-threonylcarbamoyltransferase complex transferase subunit TsaD [Candidatus Paceibacterota bacterium]
MHLLSIETSCDETAISIVKITGNFPEAHYEVLGNALFSQIDIHKEFGGVFPSIAKREHIVTILPMLKQALTESGLSTQVTSLSEGEVTNIQTLLNREPGLADELINFHTTVGKPEIDAIAVTCGPGLEPALWVGVNFAKALAQLWNVPVVPVDHMEGHILASIFSENQLAKLSFPALALLVSGGHTEIILMRDWGTYEKVGQTRDDAVGEAFDKVARLLGLPYPGGPAIGKLAEEARIANLPPYAKLPHPMLLSPDLDFSFSGLKTAVLYAINNQPLSDDDKKALARDFEDAAVTVLLQKSIKSIQKYSAKSFILGGGVSANKHLRQAISGLANYPAFNGLQVYLPEPSLSTDNSVMIALAGHAQLKNALSPTDFANNIRANGNQSL